MEIVSIGYNHIHDINFIVDRPNGCDNYLFLLIKSSAIFRINGEDIHVLPNSFMLYEPYIPQYYSADNTEHIDDFMHFLPSNEDIDFLNTLNIPRNKVIYIGDLTDISSLHKNMCFEFYSNNVHNHEISNLYFKLIFYKLNERISWIKQPTNISKNNPYIEQLIWIRTCIYQKPEEAISIDEMANNLSISRSRFQHLYKETFGSSVSQDILNSKINLACKLLRTTNLSIVDIVNTCKFSSVSYFNKKFLEKIGYNPTWYRKSNCAWKQKSQPDKNDNGPFL